MEQHMIQSEKLSSIGELASGVAHDFNNVLSAILGRAQLLLGTLNCSGQTSESTRVYESIKKDLEIIEKAALDGAETIRRIMEFARTDSDVSHFEVVDLNAIVRDALEFTRPRWKEGAQARGVLIQVETELEELPALLGNASELREVLINIVINAIDALPQGGQIRVRSYLDEPEVVVDISDSGDGIEQAIMDKIFDPFFTTKGPQATGLGMSVSYGIIKRHKGSVSVASKEGQATTFSIRLPVTEVRPRPDALPAAGVKTGKARILVVEDEEEVCILLADILNAGGHAVVAVLDGREAIELIKKEQFDMVITDLAMPGISGWQVAAEVKKCCPATPVVLVTGWSMHAEQDNENRRNVDLIVNKPFTVEKIMVTVREALCIKENTV
ncbi:MAG: response regulator [Deltaproteobacteria bacterium]|nr:response regulator [Deltaproteobacteria bacterium]